MEIGQLNQRILILEQSTKTDAIGNHKAVWAEAFPLWAAAAIRSSMNAATEQTAAGIVREVQQVIFTVRQDSRTAALTSTKHRVKFRDEEYDITGIQPDYKHNAYLQIICEVRKGSAA